MNHKSRGYALIINNRDFNSGTHMSSRKGTDQDAQSLYNQLVGPMGFDKTRVKVFNNVTACNMKKLCTSLVDHKDCDMFFCAVLSHGDSSYVYGVDGPLSLSSLLEPFKADVCPTLGGKPKVFLIQVGLLGYLRHVGETG
ncbi:caspase-3-like [Octopus sinensis]|uniref:Caspase-3-like n=1 Tax=Octopus sinensis TaxID=2607531 RepID=A0A6P7TQT0_9MOLL|nr:caspase-3-like [Octopus sinensis]